MEKASDLQSKLCTVSNAGDSSVVMPDRMLRACQQRLRMASREDYDEKDAIEQPFTQVANPLAR